MLGRAVELVEQSDTGRAGALLERQARGLPARRARASVAGVARVHEAVDRQRVLPGANSSESLTSVGAPSLSGRPGRRSPRARRHRAGARASPRPRPPSPGAVRSPARGADRGRTGTRSTLLETRCPLVSSRRRQWVMRADVTSGPRHGGSHARSSRRSASVSCDRASTRASAPRAEAPSCAGRSRPRARPVPRGRRSIRGACRVAAQLGEIVVVAEQIGQLMGSLGELLHLLRGRRLEGSARRARGPSRACATRGGCRCSAPPPRRSSPFARARRCASDPGSSASKPSISKVQAAVRVRACRCRRTRRDRGVVGLQRLQRLLALSLEPGAQLAGGVARQLSAEACSSASSVSISTEASRTPARRRPVSRNAMVLAPVGLLPQRFAPKRHGRAQPLEATCAYRAPRRRACASGRPPAPRAPDRAGRARSAG